MSIEEISDDIALAARRASVYGTPPPSYLTAAAGPAGGLLGRATECEELDSLLQDVAGGASRAIVIRGDAGIGKTALIDYVTKRRRGWHVLEAVGVESEMVMPYSGLHMLCSQLLDQIPALPGPQREALESLFGIKSGPEPHRLLVALAILSLFANAAERRPVLCTIDDAQWMDAPSANVLAIVTRRLRAERIAVVCAVRTGPNEGTAFAGLPSLLIGGLNNDDSRSLLTRRLGGRIDPDVAEQIIIECRGNPLALCEFPRYWHRMRLSGGFGFPASSEPVDRQLESTYRRVIGDLPGDTQLLVAAAAAEPLGDSLLLNRAALLLGIDMTAAVPAVDAGILHVRMRIEFPHPLIRSAAYRGMSSRIRTQVHRALAEATDRDLDPDRRAWHLACATRGLDEVTALELLRSAERARARGGVIAEAAFLGRAAELTPDPWDRARRALDAASCHVEAGLPDRAGELVSLAQAGPLDEVHHARIELILAEIALVSRRRSDATSLLLTAAIRLVPLDLDRALESFVDAFDAAHFSARADDPVGGSDIATAARSAVRPPQPDPSLVDCLLDAWITLETDYASAVPKCLAATRRICSSRTSQRDRLRWGRHATVLALETWDDATALRASEQHLRTVTEAGALGELVAAQTVRTSVLVLCGHLSEAALLVAEAESMSDATEMSAAPPYGAIMLAAWRGDEATLRSLIAAATPDLELRSDRIGLDICAYAQGVFYNSSGAYSEAVRVLSGRPEQRSVIAENLRQVELVEAATRAGERGRARAALERIEARTGAATSAWALATGARSRAMLSDAGADSHYMEALDHLRSTQVTGELARTHLLFGEWMRRNNRRVDARRQLDTALGMFTAMGMTQFAERTHRELVATGATARKRSVETSLDLTAQEAQVARLAATGLSNTEIGAKLFISSRTVEWHLRKVFTKVGITSRKQLGVALASSGLLAGRS